MSPDRAMVVIGLCALAGTAGAWPRALRPAPVAAEAWWTALAPQPEPAPEPGTDPLVASSLASLLDVGQSEAARLDAARALLGRVGSEEGRVAIVGVLRGVGEDQTSKWILVRAMAREPSLPETMLEPLVGVLTSAEGDRLARTLSAIASIRTPQALRTVAAYLDPANPEPTRAAAQAALLRATGREEVAPTLAGWTEWIDRAAAADGSDGLRPSWGAWVLRGLAERAERQAARSRELASRLTESQRRLYAEVEVSGKPALLAAMLRDEVPECRALGFELLERELVSTPNPGPEIVAAIVGLLSHTNAGVRAQAAALVGRIAPEGAGEAVAQALATEQDPAAAAALLSAAARWPSEMIREPVLRWLENGAGMRPVAAEAALAMHRAGKWEVEHVERVGTAMRMTPVSELTPAGIRLIAAIGTTEDRQRIAGLLTTGTAAQRAAVADSLTSRPEHLDAILAAAAEDQALIPAAARALAAHRPTLAGFRAVVRLRTDNETVRRDALRTVGEVLGTGDLLSAADEVGGDNATTLWLLERALGKSQAAVVANEPGAMELLRESAERLARRRLELGRPAEAIAALDMVQEQTPGSRLTALRAVALVVLGRVQDARALGVEAEAWLEALERCAAASHAPDIVAAIRQDYMGRMNESQLARFESLARRVEGDESPPPG